jgi:hypothetical protein
MVPRGPGELCDEDPVVVRSATMILVHLNSIEHTYDKSKTVSSSPYQASGVVDLSEEVFGTARRTLAVVHGRCRAERLPHLTILGNLDIST